MLQNTARSFEVHELDLEAVTSHINKLADMVMLPEFPQAILWTVNNSTVFLTFEYPSDTSVVVSRLSRELQGLCCSSPWDLSNEAQARFNIPEEAADWLRTYPVGSHLPKDMSLVFKWTTEVEGVGFSYTLAATTTREFEGDVGGGGVARVQVNRIRHWRFDVTLADRDAFAAPVVQRLKDLGYTVFKGMISSTHEP